jgi:hypothetical protein
MCRIAHKRRASPAHTIAGPVVHTTRSFSYSQKNAQTRKRKMGVEMKLRDLKRNRPILTATFFLE